MTATATGKPSHSQQNPEFGQGASSRGNGREAAVPTQIPLSGLKEVGLRTWQEASADNVGLIAAGVAFYGFLALVPLLAAIVLIYGLVADPQTVLQNMQSLTSILPADVAKLIGDLLMNVVQTSGDKKGLGLLIALAVALFGARNGAGSIITALNIAYEEEEKRSFIKVNLLALGMTAAAVFMAILAIFAVTALGYLHELFPGTHPVLVTIGRISAYVLLALAAAAAAATLYRYGPSRSAARWVWLTPGSIFTSLAWLLLTLGFGIYVANFGNYDATYGSIGAVVVLLTWMYLSSYILLFGAELNSELEHQTAKDTTEDGKQPLGSRGAWVADHVAGEAGEEEGKAAAALSKAPGEERRNPSAAVKRPPRRPDSTGREFAVSRASAALGRTAGLGKVGMISSALSTFGLAMLAKKGTAAKGAALIAAAAGLALLKREGD